MGFRDDNDGAEKVGREGTKDDVPAWPDDAAAEEDALVEYLVSLGDVGEAEETIPPVDQYGRWPI